MNRTSNSKKSWKKKMVGQWDILVRYYQIASASPSFKCWGKVCLEVCKILFSVLLKKVIEHFFKDF